MKYKKANEFWNDAGRINYSSMMFKDSVVENHINQRTRQAGLKVGRELGLKRESTILDLGCGDGAYSNMILSQYYNEIDGYDYAIDAIKTANDNAPHENIRFYQADIVHLDYENLRVYDGGYLWGILHHVKESAEDILNKLSYKVKYLVVLEPNGDNIIRKMVERTRAYRRAGEDSFKKTELDKMFRNAGYDIRTHQEFSIFPNFTPKFVFNLLKEFEPYVEKNIFLKKMCTVNLYGLESVR